MSNKQLLDYVNMQIASGMAQEEIKNALLSKGWKEGDIGEAFDINKNGGRVVNLIWTKYIYWINRISFSLSVIAVFVGDLGFIAYTFFIDRDESMAVIYTIFWMIMLVVLGAFFTIYKQERDVLTQKFKNSRSGKDGWILTLILLRNAVFMVNFVPYIQVYGMMLIFYTVIPYQVVYSLLLKARSKEI